MNFFKRRICLFSPCEGTLHPLSELNDGLFSEELLGKGCYFRSDKGEICAPCDGVVKSIIATNHAIGIEGPGKIEILIHIGLDSEKVSHEKCFTLHVKLNENVTKGQLLISYSKEKLQSIGYDDPIIMTILNSKEYKNVMEADIGETNIDKKALVVIL